MPVMKQCSQCGEGYDFELKRCPSCEYQGFKIIDVGQGAPSDVPGMQAGDENTTSPPPPPPPAEPVAPQPAAGAGSPAAEPDGLAGMRQMIAVSSWVVVGVMLLSFTMVWAQASIAALSYFDMCRLLLENLEDAMNLAGLRVLGLFVPLAAAGILGVAALSNSVEPRTPVGHVGMLAGGLLALIAAWQVYDYVAQSGAGFIDLTGVLGPGLKLFAIAGFAGFAVGIIGMIVAASPGTASAPRTTPRTAAPPEAAATAQPAHSAPSAPALPEVDWAAAAGFVRNHGTAFMGAGGILLAFMLLWWGVPKLQHAKAEAQAASCRNNIKQLSTAVSMYLADYDGYYPAVDGWGDATFGYVFDEGVYTCPLRTVGEGGYAMNSNLRGASDRESDPNQAVLFESSAGPNQWGLPSESMIFPHFDRGNCSLRNGLTTTAAPHSDMHELDGSPPVSAAASNIMPPPDSVSDSPHLRLGEAESLLYRWRDAWEAQDLDTLMAFYSPYFRGEGKGYDQWRREKQSAFQRYTSINVGISNLELRPEGDGARVTFTQSYSARGPSRNYSSTGQKTMRLEYSRVGWLIMSEELVKR